MATATEEPKAADGIPEPIPERDDITKAKRHVFNRHLAHEGLMLDKMQRELRMAEKMQQFASSGDAKDLEWTEEDEEAMGVNIGNEYHIHQQLPAKSESSANPTTAPTPTSEAPVPTSEAPVPTEKQPPVTKSKSLWPNALLALSMLGGGAGLGYIVNDLLKPKPAPAVGTDVDTDTIVEMDFPEE